MTPFLDLQDLWVIVTCKGRLAFLRRSLPSVLRSLPGSYCLVDYDCPEGSGDWVASEYPEQVASGRVVVQRVRGSQHFHKADALNQGARRALAGGASHLCFLDADTLVLDGYWCWLAEHWEHTRFLTVALDGARSLFGVLALRASDFERAGGYDEWFRGWGNEDLELRLRLHLAYGLGYALIPARFLAAIPHGDELRTQHYLQKDKQASFDESWAYTVNKVVGWTGSLPWDLGPSVSVLMHPLESEDHLANYPQLLPFSTEGAPGIGATPPLDASQWALRTERGWRRRVGRR